MGEMLNTFTLKISTDSCDNAETENMDPSSQ